MEIQIQSENTIKVVSFSGDLNAVTSPEAETTLNNLIMGGNKKLVINLADLNYISSAGLRVFLTANKQIKKKEGELRICCLNDLVKEVFEISGFDFIFTIYPSREEALKDF